MTSKVQIWNQALSLGGSSSRVENETENTKARRVCELWWDEIRTNALAGAFWPSARRRAYLPLLKERANADWVAGDPDPKYCFAYGLPHDYIHARFLSTYAQFDIAWDSTYAAKVLSTNVSPALLEFSFDQTLVTTWEPGLRRAITHGLAAYISMEMHGKTVRTRDLFEQADVTILEARAQYANSADSQQEAVPPWLTAGGYGDGAPQPQYFHPYSPRLAPTYFPAQGYSYS